MKFEIVEYIYDCIPSTKFGQIQSNSSRINEKTNHKTVDLRTPIISTLPLELLLETFLNIR
jgi:hypothetical protein